MKILSTILVLLAAVAAAQQQPQPQVRVNVLNVCTPGPAEQKEIASALARIPRRPALAPDFEIARGRSTAPDAPVARWVRIRREFPAESPFGSVQYSFSVDEQGVIETLVLRLREPKDLMQIAIERAAAPTGPEEALAAEAAASRIKLERFGKSSVALARCPAADQSAYETLFRNASDVLGAYRSALNVRRTVPADLARIEAATPKRPAAKKLTH